MLTTLTNVAPLSSDTVEAARGRATIELHRARSARRGEEISAARAHAAGNAPHFDILTAAIEQERYWESVVSGFDALAVTVVAESMSAEIETVLAQRNHLQQLLAGLEKERTAALDPLRTWQDDPNNLARGRYDVRNDYIDNIDRRIAGTGDMLSRTYDEHRRLTNELAKYMQANRDVFNAQPLKRAPARPASTLTPSDTFDVPPDGLMGHES
jgi:hypothetical protein